MFEAVHGTAPDIAGQGKANPCALLAAAAQMLDHLGMADKATRLRDAIVATLEARDNLTPDLGGQGNTMGFAKAIASRRSEEHTSELESLMRISYAVFCLKKKNTKEHTEQD